MIQIYNFQIHTEISPIDAPLYSVRWGKLAQESLKSRNLSQHSRQYDWLHLPSNNPRWKESINTRESQDWQ